MKLLQWWAGQRPGDPACDTALGMYKRVVLKLSGEALAAGVRRVDAAEVAALAGPGAGDEERHVGRLRCLS